MKRYFPIPLLLLLLLVLGSCKKDEVAAPQTGNLIVRFTYDASLSEATYALYTEQAWTSLGSVSALRTGTLARINRNTTSLQAQITLNDLNAGNYIFVVGSERWSMQVTAGKTNEVNR